MKPLGIEEVLWVKPGEGIAATGHIPQDAEFFKDHFPGFPVLPGVLALEMLRISAEFYFRSQGIEDAALRMRRLSAVRFSKYLQPGDTWQSELLLKPGAEAPLSLWAGRLFCHGEVAVTARLELELIQKTRKIIA